MAIEQEQYKRMSEWTSIAEEYAQGATLNGEETVQMLTAFILVGCAQIRQILAENPPTPVSDDEEGEEDEEEDEAF